jgi:rfaE bifunctional protein kinase chain/domain
MNPRRFAEITRRYPGLRIAVIGDFSLDRYLEIDPGLKETSIETGLTVHNVTRVRAQPGSAGTILNNLSALGVGVIYPIGFCGVDGEGFELMEALRARSGVRLDHFLQTTRRCTFTYCKPLITKRGALPRELNRLARKNWTPTPPVVQDQIIESLNAAAGRVDAIIIMDQVDLARTGVVTPGVLRAVRRIAHERSSLPIVADSRRGLRGFPSVIFKMNATELAALTGAKGTDDVGKVRTRAVQLAEANKRKVFVTLAERGIVGADADGHTAHAPAWPVRGPIDIVGAGDAVTANLTAALAAGGDLEETLELANAAASIVVHQLGTTGTATVLQLAGRLGFKATTRLRRAAAPPRRAPAKGR